MANPYDSQQGGGQQQYPQGSGYQGAGSQQQYPGHQGSGFQGPGSQQQYPQGSGYQGAGLQQQYPGHQGSGLQQQSPQYQRPPKKSRTWLWLGGGATLLVLLLGGCVAVVLAAAPPEFSDEDELAIGQACAGTGAPGAGSYVGGTSGFVTFGQEEPGGLYTHDIFNPSVVDDQPGELADITTVLCLDAPTLTVGGICEVGTVLKEDYEIVYKERVGRLVDPSTGEVIAETTVESFPDEECEGFGDRVSEDDFIAEDPGAKEFDSWLASTL